MYLKNCDGESQLLILFQSAESMEEFFKKFKASGTAIAQNLSIIKELPATQGHAGCRSTLKIPGPGFIIDLAA